VVVVIGVDAHKKSHTLVAVDANGRKLAEKTVEATDAGHAKALRWALLKFGDGELMWASRIAGMCRRDSSAAWSMRGSGSSGFPPS
jgi:transposase